MEIVVRRGLPATSQLRTVFDLSRRLSLIEAVVVVDLAGLPRPQAQVPVHDALGRFVGRPDLYYPAYRLGLEFDRGTHRTSLVEDNRPQNLLVNAGCRLVRFAAADIYTSPEAIIAQVRGAISASRLSASL